MPEWQVWYEPWGWRPEEREPAVWMLMQPRGTANRSLSICRLCTHSNCWLDGGPRMLGLLVVPCPIRKFMMEAYMKA